MIREVDAFSLACNDDNTAKEIYNIIGISLRLPKEDKDPFVQHPRLLMDTIVYVIAITNASVS